MSTDRRKLPIWQQRDYCYQCDLQLQYDKMSRPNQCVALWELQKEAKFTDVTILLDDGHRIPAHRNVLAASLPSRTAELASGTISWPGMSKELCRTVLEYIYTGERVVSTDNAPDVLPAARQLRLRSLEMTCQNLQRSLSRGHPPVKKARSCFYVETGVDLMRELKAQREKGRHTDWEVEVEGRKFPVHQNVLAAGCPYFKAMLTQDMEERRRGGVTLPFSLQVWGAVLDWLYLLDTKLVCDCIQDDPEGLINAAEMLLLPDLKKIISGHLGKKLGGTDKVGDIFRKYYLYQIPSVHLYLLQNFHQICYSRDFLSLEAKHLVEVLSCPRLQVLSEEAVSNCIVKWLLLNPTASAQDVGSLVGQIRPEDLSSSYLNQTWWRLCDLGTTALMLITGVFDNERRRRQLSREEPVVPADCKPRRRGLRMEPSVYGPGTGLVVVSQGPGYMVVQEWDFGGKKWLTRYTAELVNGETLGSHRAAISPEDGSVLVMALHDHHTKCCCVLLTRQHQRLHPASVCQNLKQSEPNDDFALAVSGTDFYTVQRSPENTPPQRPSMVIHRLDRSGRDCRWVEVGRLERVVRDVLAVATERQVVVVGSSPGLGCAVEVQVLDLRTGQCCACSLDLAHRVWFHLGLVLGGEVWFVGMNGHLTQVNCDGSKIQLENRDMVGLRRFGKVAAFAHRNGSIGLIGGISTWAKATENESTTVHPYGDSVARSDNSINTSGLQYGRCVMAAALCGSTCG